MRYLHWVYEVADEAEKYIGKSGYTNVYNVVRAAVGDTPDCEINNGTVFCGNIRVVSLEDLAKDIRNILIHFRIIEEWEFCL